MPIDYSLLALPKHKPGVLTRKAKKRTKAAAWRKATKAVDARDEQDGAPACFITGRRLSTNTTDEWRFRDRAHIVARSRDSKRIDDPNNVISCSRAVHNLIDKSALLLFNKRGLPATSVKTIDHVAWNRRWIKRGEEPCRIRKGLAVVELDKVVA